MRLMCTLSQVNGDSSGRRFESSDGLASLIGHMLRWQRLIVTDCTAVTVAEGSDFSGPTWDRRTTMASNVRVTVAAWLLYPLVVFVATVTR